MSTMVVEDIRTSPSRQLQQQQQQQQPRPFRESCQNCADSKVRCSKDKPTCARCARRGTPCVYQQSRRAGRKVSSATQAKHARRATVETLNEVSPPDTWAMSNVDSSSSMISPLGSETLSTVIPEQEAPVDNQVCSDTLSIMEIDPVSDPSDPAAWWSNELFKALCTDSAPFINGDDADFLTNVSHDLVSMEDDSLILGDAASVAALFDDPGLTSLSLPSTRLDGAVTTPSAGYLSGGETTSSSSVACTECCPAVISRLIPELFLSCGRTCERNQAQSAEPQRESLADIIARNKRISEAMDAMVECACSQDIHVLFLVGLCTSKVMSYYLVATQREQQYLKSAQRAGDSFSTNEYQQSRPEWEDDDTEAKIMSARMVLGELHRIQRLLARFSERLKRKELKGDLANGSTDLGDASKTGMETPFTRLMLEQLDHSLRAHLRYVFKCMSLVAQRA